MACETPIHVLLVSFPAQGHVNPLLRLGKHLAAKGFFVTFSTTKRIGKDMPAANSINETSATPIGDGFLNFEFFEDGLADDADPLMNTLEAYTTQLEVFGKQVVSQVIKMHAEANRPVSCIINNPFVSWVCDVATEHGIPCTMYWIHSSASFTACYHYFKKLSPFPTESEPYLDVQLPNILLKYNEIPEFLHPFSPISTVRTLIMKQFKNLSKTFCVIMDTFEELQCDYLNYLSKFFLIRPVRPLFKNSKALGTDNVRGDFFKADDCIDWLSSQPPASVVYVSLDTIMSLPPEQVGEIAYGLLNSQVSFLWVLRPSQRDQALESGVLPDGFFERTSDRGKVVQWCPQEEVLAHPSVACYLTHCGWNSTVETLASGVPMLTFSLFSDQVTNAKFIVDVFGVGIRVSRHSIVENKTITRDEIEKHFLEAMVAPKAKELKKNALKWKNAAEAARVPGGSSDRNLDAFVRDIKKCVASDIKNIPI